MISALRWDKPDTVLPHFSNYGELCMDSNSKNKQIPKTWWNTQQYKNEFLKNRKQAVFSPEVCFPLCFEVNTLPATIQKSTHLRDIQTTGKLKKNREEQTQLLKRETARLSSVALISIQCFSEEIFISKDQAGQESNQTQARTHTRGKASISLWTADKRRSFDVARPNQKSVRHTYRVVKW